MKEYSIGMLGFANDVRIIRYLLDEMLSLDSSLMELNSFDEDDDERIDVVLTYTTEDKFTRNQLDDVLAECFAMSASARDWDVAHGEWVYRETI